MKTLKFGVKTTPSCLGAFLARFMGRNFHSFRTPRVPGGDTCPLYNALSLGLYKGEGVGDAARAIIAAGYDACVENLEQYAKGGSFSLLGEREILFTSESGVKIRLFVKEAKRQGGSPEIELAVEVEFGRDSIMLSRDLLGAALSGGPAICNMAEALEAAAADERRLETKEVCASV